MIHLFAFTLSIFGLAFCVGASKISLPFRAAIDPGNKIDGPGKLARTWFLTLLECPACLSVWLGLAAVVADVAPPVFGSGIQGGVFCAFYCCATSLLLARIAGLDD